MTPRRVQLRRTKGWCMPENTVKVDRSTGWGNPYVPGDYLDKGPYTGTTVRDVMHAVVLFREWALAALAGRGIRIAGSEATMALEELRGHNLACWCPLDQPCHADVLLELANTPARDAGRNG